MPKETRTRQKTNSQVRAFLLASFSVYCAGGGGGGVASSWSASRSTEADKGECWNWAGVPLPLPHLSALVLAFALDTDDTARQGFAASVVAALERTLGAGSSAGEAAQGDVKGEVETPAWSVLLAGQAPPLLAAHPAPAAGRPGPSRRPPRFVPAGTAERRRPSPARGLGRRRPGPARPTPRALPGAPRRPEALEALARRGTSRSTAARARRRSAAPRPPAGLCPRPTRPWTTETKVRR
jgi:hypothetical protein